MLKQKSIALILGVLTMSLLISYIVLAAWTNPTATPPGDNVPAPFNVGPENQIKEGSLTLGGLTVDKLTVNTIDPVFEIDGQNYATYVSDFAGGTRMETAGSVFVDQSYVIDFNDLEKGSNLWLFWKTSNRNMDDLVVNLTCGFSGSAWYEKKDNSLIIKTDKAGEVSYLMSLPRFDYLKWPNLIEDGTVKGINISK